MSKILKLVLDAGFRQTKITRDLNPNCVEVRPSVVAQGAGVYRPPITGGLSRRKPPLAVSYIDGPAEGYIGKHYVLGDDAREMRNRVDAFSLGKPEWGLLNSLAAVGTGESKVSLQVDALHHAPTAAVLQQYEQLFIGKHTIRIGATPVTVTIEEVRVHLESIGSYFWALANNQLPRVESAPSFINYVIDVGGSTMTGLTVDEYGDPIANSQYTLTKGGTIEFAQIISEHYQFRELFERGGHGDSSPNLATIMDGLADMSYKYGNSFCFFGEDGAIMSYAAETWRERIMQQVKGRLSPWLNSYNHTLVTGGSADYLYRAMMGSKNKALRPVLCKDYATANVRGVTHQLLQLQAGDTVTALRRGAA